MSSNSSRDRVRPAAHPPSGNGAVPIAAGPPRAVAWALAYACRGWPVFPCQPGTKEPATRHGFHDASTDQDQIRSWWERNPHANLAIATGAPGPDLLDVDHHGPAGNGYTALMRLKHADLLDAAGTIVRTPHSGLHVYFSGSRQASGRLPRHHLDFKSAGGYVLAPPSQVDGKSYRLVREAVPSGGLGWAAVTGLLEPLADWPARPVLACSGDAGRLAAWVEQLEEGNRNAGLFRAACRAVEAGQPGWLYEIAAAAAKTGLAEREISRTIDSARRGRECRAGRQAEWEAARRTP
jgi:hypothetical protein